MKVSLILSSFKRANLLRLGLSSILRFKPEFPLEILVVNDGLKDDTEMVCNQFREKGLDIKYIFSGQRHMDGIIKWRVSGFALNIGLKQSTGDIIVLSCPEIHHLNNALFTIASTVEISPKGIVIPNHLYFDRAQTVTNYLLGLTDEQLQSAVVDKDLLVGGHHNDEWSRGNIMPFCMGIRKSEIMEIGGYDEDFTGYAGDDNDFCERLIAKGLTYVRVAGQVVHLFHEGSNDGQMHENNPDWVYNWNLLKGRRGIIVRNVGREWGKIDG